MRHLAFQHTLYINKCLAILFLSIAVSFISCSAQIPKDEDFSFYLEAPQIMVQHGEIVIYHAELYNASSRKYQLQHGIPLISFYVGTELPNEKKPIVGATLTQTTIAANAIISRDIRIEFQERGEYYLYVFCSFRIGNRDFYLETDVVVIQVI